MAANPSIQLGTDGNWAIKEDNLLAYKKDGTRFFNKEFDFTRNTTATFVDKDGLIKESATNTPRIDFTDDATGHLLLEPQRTNVFEYSEDFSVSYWLKLAAGSASAPIVTADYATSPDCTQNATRVQFDAVGTSDADRSGLVRTFAFTTGQTYSISCWVKSTNGTSQVIQFRIAGVQISEEQTATSEWKLYTATFTATVSTTDQFGMQIRGINSVNESDILIYGMQLELLDYPTSYIPTSGSTYQRQSDVVNGSGNSEVFNDSEGVLFADKSALEDSTIQRWISVGSGSNANRVSILFNATSRINCSVRGSSTAIYDAFANVGSQTLVSKAAVKYKNSDFSFFVNGFKVDSQQSGSVSFNAPLSELAFDSADGASDFYGKTKEIGYYDATLTDEELEYLTSYRSLNELVTELNLNTL